MSDEAHALDKAAKLAKMANSIGENFALMGQEQAATATASHLRKFWTPKMIREIVLQASQDEPGLNPTTLAAIKHLQASQA
jgi:formate dehydrogenase subunit delta